MVPNKKNIPEIFIEDTFDLNNLETSSKKIIENKIKKRQIKSISLNDLLQSKTFKFKLKSIIAEIDYEKNFNILLDFKNSLNKFKIYDDILDIDKDEMDIILDKISDHYIKKLASKTLNYQDYKIINVYLNNLKISYQVFKNNSIIDNKTNNEILKNMIDMAPIIERILF
jgi:hypothetical protein